MTIDDEPTHTGNAPDGSGAGDLGPPRLVVIAGPQSGRRYPLGEAAVIGRGVEATIPLEDGRCSRVHARLSKRSPLSYELEDMGSTNGTWVNGESIRRRSLGFGDNIRVGDTVFLFTHPNPMEDEISQRERLELLGRLGAGIAHDFNNLLAAAHSSIDYLQTLPGKTALDQPDVADCFSDLRSTIVQASEMALRLLSFSRPKAHIFDFIDLPSLCNEVASLLKRTTPRAVDIHLDTPEAIEVLGDRGQLHQALMNVCVNARDAMPNGGRMTISLKRRPAPADGRTGQDTAILTVTDTGVGMTDDVQAQAFKPFFSTKDKTGTGLGLSNVRDVVRFHGGDVELQSQVGVGTTIIVKLPAAPQQRGRNRTNTFSGLRTQANPQPPSVNDHLRILVADDNPTVCRTLSRLLRSFGHDVILAKNGAEAVEKFRTENPDLILMDFDMPVLPGIEALQQIRAINRNVPVVLMSGHSASTLQSRDDGYPGGPPVFLQKPYGAKEVHAAIVTALEGVPGA